MAGAMEFEEEEEEKQYPYLSYLPNDSTVEMEILPRFPLKSLLRFQSVSKYWLHLISRHLRQFRLHDATSGLFFRLPISSSSNRFYSATHLTKTNIDATLSFLPPHHSLHVIDGCNGLLLCRFFSKEDHDMVLCVCNPFTGRHVILPELLYSSWESLVLVFDRRVSRHFRIIYFGSYLLRIFLSEVGGWVMKPQIGYCVYALSLINENRVVLGGRIYLASNRNPFLLAFDREGDYVGRTDLPHPGLGERRRRLGHSRGRICYALKVDGEMRVWVLEDFDRSLWVLKCSVSLEVLLPGSSSPGGESDYPHVMRFHPDSDVVFLRVEGKLLSYDLGSGELAEVCTCGELKGQAAFAYSPFYSEDVNL